MTDQWSSTSSSRSPPPQLLNHHAGNNKPWRMDSGGISGILDPPLNQAGLQGAARAQEDGTDDQTKLPSSKYKGVVPQPNGRWGAQIYDKQQRLWLGTFDDEESAAKGYDIAAQRLRGWNTHTNFKPLISSSSSSSSTEMRFLMSRPQADIIHMVRRQTYYPELERSRRKSSNNSPHGGHSEAPSPPPPPRVKLFEKMLTPSDVGKLNRLVIPKEQAERHFPPLGGPEGCMFLIFLDANDKVWRFRYSYWNSSRSYVLTRGWTLFIKENHLLAGDVVIFERSSGPEKQLYINFRSTRVDVHDREVLHELPPRTGPVLRLFGVDISTTLAR